MKVKLLREREVCNLRAVWYVVLAFILTWEAYLCFLRNDWISIGLGFVTAVLTLPCYYLMALHVYLATVFPKPEVTLLRRFTGWYRKPIVQFWWCVAYSLVFTGMAVFLGHRAFNDFANPYFTDFPWAYSGLAVCVVGLLYSIRRAWYERQWVVANRLTARTDVLHLPYTD